VTSTRISMALAILMFAAAAAAIAATPPTPSATLVDSRGYPQSSIVMTRLDGSASTPLTRKVARYEVRADTRATFAPDGSTVVFIRESKRDPASVMRVARDGAGIRRLLTLAQARRLAPQTRSLGSTLFSRDGSELIIAAYNGCSTEALLSVATDGGRPPQVLWRLPRNARLGLYPSGFLDDGTLVATSSAHDGDCYYGHTGPDRLLLLNPGVTPRPLGPPSDAIGGVRLMPDGQTVVWAAGCLETCQLWSANPLTGRTRKLTSFRTRTSPLSGYDIISFAPLTETTIVYGRGQSVIAHQLASSTGRPLKTFGCPRDRCGLTEVSSIVPSPDGTWLIVGVYDHGCEYCEADSPKPTSQRFALRIDDRSVTRLPVVAFDDIHFD
jgi:hypothetical protein